MTTFIPYFEFQDLHLKYNQLWKCMHDLLELLKEMELRNIKEKEDSKIKIKKRCKFYDRGVCNNGRACKFVHPPHNCQNQYDGKECVNGTFCKARHPPICRYWTQGKCFRGESCLFLHNEKDRDASEVDTDVCDTLEKEHDQINESLQEMPSVEEIINYYENKDDDQYETEVEHEEISTEEIIKLYENVDTIDEELKKIYDNKIKYRYTRNEMESTGLQRSSRKILKKKMKPI